MTVPLFPPAPADAGQDNSPSVARKINQEIVILLGWGPAILCQFAHPLVAAGVDHHSSFRATPAERLGRLRGTVEAMLALTFGSAEEVGRAAAGINAIHDRVQGRLPDTAGPFPAGTAYSAHDPELLRWVHCTMLELLPRTYELYVGPLTDAEKERYCDEASRVAPLLGLPWGYLPESRSALQAYFDAMLDSGEIVVTATARQLARALLDPPLPRMAWPLRRLTRLPAIGLLPPSIRAGYGFRWEPLHQTALRDAARLTRAVLPLLPSRVRYWPLARGEPDRVSVA